MEKGRRRVRSFVRRAGRTTAAQARALAEFWPLYGVEKPADRLDLNAVFGRQAPRHCEIGFGDGAALSAAAALHPELDFLGIEVHEPGIGRLLLAVEDKGLTNVRIVRHDAVEVLDRWLPDACLDRVNIFFPDPWPKKRHHKRRLVQAPFLATLYRVMRPGAVLHMATDWEPYAEQMLDVTDAFPGFGNMAGDGRYSARPEERPQTRFERRGLRLGHGVRDLLYVRTGT
jgi:tRNA (guanine-N7-)-methyltransferase